jgi:hypothetical protein
MAKARQLSKVSVLWAEILSKTPINRIKAAIFFIIVFLFCCFLSCLCNKNKTNLQESHILDVILKYFYNSAICIFTAFAWWRKKQPVCFQPAVFLLNILKERMFLVISC